MTITLAGMWERKRFLEMASASNHTFSSGQVRASTRRLKPSSSGKARSVVPTIDAVGTTELDTTATVWLGLTMGCARCHEHKYDPISQTEYYRLFAYFNNVAENAMDGNQRDPPPTVRAITPVEL